MPRYYFHIKDGEFLPDIEGTELPDVSAAREAALVLSGEMLRDGGGANLWNGGDWSLWVTQQPDHKAQKLFTLRFSDRDSGLVRSSRSADCPSCSWVPGLVQEHSPGMTVGGE